MGFFLLPLFMNQQLFTEFARQYRYVPVSRELMADILTPVSLFYSVREGARRPFLLESVEGGEQVARYSFIGFNPYQSLEYIDNEVRLVDFKKGGSQLLEEYYFDALKHLTASLDSPEIPDLPRFTGGAVGYSSYDTILETEQIDQGHKEPLSVPKAVWSFYDKVYAFDHVKHRVLLIHLVDVQAFEDLEQAWKSATSVLDAMQQRAQRSVPAVPKVALNPEAIDSNMSREDFEKAVLRVKEHIFEGDIFQAVLSQRFEATYEGDEFMLYRALRMVNPSPYLFFIQKEDFCLIGSSPEVLVSVEHQEVRLLPIAGTRKRGATPQEDDALEQDLLADEKEQAEHIMLVDLGRNDLTRVCDPPTVRVTRQAYIERYSHVMHIVSEVKGELQKGLSSVDALIKCAPAGTVSGAPKIRAMQIIEGLEPTRRGPYAGAVGYFDHFGNMDTCIAIRTMIARKGHLHIQAGAGIVADSQPDKEYEETVNKAKALFSAMEKALNIA